MEFYYLIIFGFVGLCAYSGIKKEGILWIPRAIVNIGGFLFWGYLTFVHYGNIDNSFLKIFAIAGTMIALVGIALPINEILDEAIIKRLGKDPYAPNKKEE